MHDLKSKFHSLVWKLNLKKYLRPLTIKSPKDNNEKRVQKEPDKKHPSAPRAKLPPFFT